MRARTALYLSVAVIVLYWTIAIAQPLFRSSGPAMPDSVAQLALYAFVRAAIVLAVVWPLLRAGGERLTDLGLGRWAWGTALLRGVLLAVAIFVVVNLLLNGLVSVLLGGSGTSAAVKALFRDPREAPYWVFAAVVGGGFTEELQRAFVLTRFELLGGRAGLAAAVVVDSIVFGLGHLYQGTAGAVTTGLTGLAFALIFLSRRRVADAMVAHAGFDLIGVAAAYALYAPAA